MHSRFPAGWRFTLWTAVLVTLILLPVSAALAEQPTTIVERGANSLRAVDGQQDDPRSRPAVYSRANYVWPYEVGPYYGGLDQVALKAPGVVKTTVGSFDLIAGELNIPAALKATNKLGQQPAQYFIVSLDPASGEAGADVLASIEAGWDNGQALRDTLRRICHRITEMDPLDLLGGQ